jgi:hypothetical protein
VTPAEGAASGDRRTLSVIAVALAMVFAVPVIAKGATALGWSDLSAVQRSADLDGSDDVVMWLVTGAESCVVGLVACRRLRAASVLAAALSAAFSLRFIAGSLAGSGMASCGCLGSLEIGWGGHVGIVCGMLLVSREALCASWACAVRP